MKKMLKILAILLLLPSAIVAQKPFTISGTVKELKDGDTILLHSNKTTIDSAIVNGGVFKLNGKIGEPAMASLILISKAPAAPEKSKSTFVDMLNLFIEPGQIVITGIDSLKTSTVSGSPINIDSKRYDLARSPVTQKYIGLNAKLVNLTPEQRKDVQLMAAMKAEFDKLEKESSAIRYSFIKSNPNAYFSLMLLQRQIGNNEYLQEAGGLFAAFAPDLKATTIGKSIASRLEALKKVAIGEMAIDFEQNDVSGKPVKLSDYKGKYVLVDFWASWCSPCREENPNLIVAYQKYKAKGFTIIGISADKDKEKWLKAIKEDKMSWTQLCDLTGDNPILSMYGVEAIPSNFLLDPTGKIIASQLRGVELENKLEQILAK